MVRDLIEGNVVTTKNSDSKERAERKLLYIRYLRLFLALGYVAFIFGVLAFFTVSQEVNMILFGMYGTAASIFAMAMVGLLWVTNDTSSTSANSKWQFQFLVIVCLLLIVTAFLFLGITMFVLPYTLVVYLYVARFIRGA